jgi:hypothetical protein
VLPHGIHDQLAFAIEVMVVMMMYDSDSDGYDEHGNEEDVGKYI